MKKFSISLNQSQEIFLTTYFPKGYSFVKFNENSVNNHFDSDPKNIKNDPFISQKDLSSQSSNSHQSNLKHKDKRSNQQKESKELISTEKSKSKLSKVSNPSQNTKISQKVQILHKLLNQIEKKKLSSIFIEPVDPIKLQIPNYFDIIKKPMAIQTMRKKLKQGKYEEFSLFEEDLETIVSNCIKFNAGNNFFIQAAKKFSIEYKKVLQKHKEEIDKNFKLQTTDMQSRSIESNSEQQTNSDEKIESKNSKKIKKKGLTSDKIKEKDEQNLKKVSNNEDKKNGHQDKQKINSNTNTENKITSKEQIKLSTEKKQQLDKLNQIETDQKRIQKEDQQEKVKKFQKLEKVKEKKSIRIKKYSYEDRLAVISRIKKLDRITMSQFFKEINFSKGESLDFKVLEEEKIREIEEKLKAYEKIHQQKVEKIMKLVQEKKGKEDFEIEEDKDYED